MSNQNQINTICGDICEYLKEEFNAVNTMVVWGGDSERFVDEYFDRQDKIAKLRKKLEQLRKVKP